MADCNSSIEPPSTNRIKNKKKKRKQTSTENNELEEAQDQSGAVPSKLPRIDESEREIPEINMELEEGSPWRNLQLILYLQNKNVDLVKKVDLAVSYVNSVSNETVDNICQSVEMINTYRVLDFMNNWVQSVLIMSEKKMRLEGNKTEHQDCPSLCLDIRCWKIFKFCLQESQNLLVSLTCSRELLRVFHFITRDALSHVNNAPSCCEVALSSDQLKFYDTVLNCISLIFSSHGGVSNENLDLWISATKELLKLTLKLVTDNLDSCKAGNLLMQLSCRLLEPFPKFLRVHPMRKNGFRDFIDELLEPLLHLLIALHSDFGGGNSECRRNVSTLIEEVLAQGIFHPTHIDGFLHVQGSDICKSSFDGTLIEEKLVNKSYHRHLFDKLGKIVANKNEFALCGLGKLLHLFVNSVTKQKGTSVSIGGSRGLEIRLTNHASESSNGVDAETRKSVFEFFMHIMKPLLADINKYLIVDVELGPVLTDLRAINNLLACIVHEKVYVRMEDISEGASNTFLRLFYDLLVLFSAKINDLKVSSFALEKISQRDVLISTRKELIVSVHHLFDIEYNVVGDDLESLWNVIFSSVACSNSSTHVLDQSVLSSEILSLECSLVDLYSELRQLTPLVICSTQNGLAHLNKDNGVSSCLNSIMRNST